MKRLPFLKKIRFWGLVFFVISCENTEKEVRDFLADKNLPIGIAEDMIHKYKDSGKVIFKLVAPLFKDFSNRENMPYQEFPKGLKIVSINRITRDSTSVKGDYGIMYSKTAISEIVGHVQVKNYKEKLHLKTSQMYWDQNTGYFFTEEKFTLIATNEQGEKDTIKGKGFESLQDLSAWHMKKIKGTLSIKQEK